MTPRDRYNELRRIHAAALDSWSRGNGDSATVAWAYARMVEARNQLEAALEPES